MEQPSSTGATRYSDAELEEFRVLVNEKLEKALHELDFMQSQLSEMSENTNNKNSGDLFDDSSLHTEIEMMSRMISRQQQFVRNLEAALFRIRNKTYGICSVTGQLISKDRLMLVPHATKSVLGKEEEKKIQAQEPFRGAYSGVNPLSGNESGADD
ncbi:MAG: TraR/DksA family transcriptional regulator [Saprospiraceae bacterium]